MSLNTPEFEPRKDYEAEGNPLDGRDGQPVEEGSSDDPRALSTMDPLRDEELEVDELAGHEAQAEGELPFSEAERMAAQADMEHASDVRAGEGQPDLSDTAGARVPQPNDAAGQEADGLDALGRPLPEDSPQG
ncbi:hypothetical protein [Paeniglutamicibacter antarcticus]|uniref:DUF5709 domain-containing protein n=1 Tax=Paeniglutamicibacter antarcticus TaxID=494023 RepID=A0ABP9TJK0_9MICC